MSSANLTKTVSILGCGWFGTPLAMELIGRGWMVKGSTTTREKLHRLEEKGIESFLLKGESDLKGEGLDRFFRSRVLVLNIPPFRGKGDVLERFPLLVRDILEKAIKGEVKKVLFISSISVYGKDQGRVDENTLPNPTTNSGKALFQCERIVKDLFGKTGVIIRPGGLVDDERNPVKYLAGRKDVSGSQEPVNLIHLKDLVKFSLIMMDKAWEGGALDLVAPEHPTRREFYVRAAEKFGLEPPVFSDKSNGEGKWVDPVVVERDLGYSFTYPDPFSML